MYILWVCQNLYWSKLYIIFIGRDVNTVGLVVIYTMLILI